VGAGGGGVLDHQIVGFLAGPLGKLGVDRDVAAEQRLNPGADVADDAARAHRQSAHHAEVLGHAIPRNIVGGGDDHMSLPTKWPGSCPAIRILVRAAGANYSMMLATTPAPTVRPPSRMAKRSFSSIAIGTIRCTSIAMLSPGMTISVPSGRCTTPVTSVVRK